MRKFKSRRKQFKKVKKKVGGEVGENFRVRLPRGKELFAHVNTLSGGKRMIVTCSDGKERMARVPGKLKRIWVRLDDYVLVIPWELEGDKKCDISWRYRQTEVDWLKNHGYLKGL